MSSYPTSSAYASGSVLHQFLTAATTVSEQAKSWVTMLGAQSIERARLRADTTVQLAALQAGLRPTVPTVIGGGGGQVLGQVGAWMPYLLLGLLGLGLVRMLK